MTAIDTNVATIGDNSKKKLGAIKEVFNKLGQLSVKGGAARVDAAVKLAEQVHLGQMDESDVDEVYAAYAAGQAKAAASSLTAEKPNDKSLAAQKAKFRTFAKLAKLPAIDAPALLDAAAKLRVGLEDAKPPFDALLDVARAQIKAPTETLNDEEIVAAMTKPERTDKDDLARLVAAYKAASKLAELVPMQAVIDAVECYRSAIVDAGGEVPALTKEEKEHAAFMERAAKMGFVVVVPEARQITHIAAE